MTFDVRTFVLSSCLVPLGFLVPIRFACFFYKGFGRSMLFLCCWMLRVPLIICFSAFVLFPLLTSEGDLGLRNRFIKFEINNLRVSLAIYCTFFIRAAILLFMAFFFKHLSSLFLFPVGWLEVKAQRTVNLAPVPFDVAVASPFAG